MEELHVRRVVLLVEAVGARVGDDHRPPLLHERRVAVAVEQVPLGHHLHEQRVQERVHVVRADVRDAGDQDVRLPVDRDDVLLVAARERVGVDRFGLTGEDARDAVGGGDAVEDRLARALREGVERELEPLQRRLLVAGEIVLVLVEELERAIEHAVVDRGLDGEDVQRLVRDATHAIHARRQLARLRVHVAVAAPHRVRLVVEAEALVPAEPHGHRLVPAVHGDEVQVHVDEQIALDGLAIQLDDLAVVGRADLLHPLGVFGVVVVEALRPVGVEDLRADHVPHLGSRHAAVERGGDDDLDVLDAVIGEQLEHDREHALAHVGRAHRGEGERDVVDGDDDLHPGAELRVERIGAVRVAEGVADGRVDVLQGLERLARVDGARAGGEVDVDEAIAREDRPRRATAVERDHERAALPPVRRRARLHRAKCTGEESVHHDGLSIRRTGQPCADASWARR